MRWKAWFGTTRPAGELTTSSGCHRRREFPYRPYLTSWKRNKRWSGLSAMRTGFANWPRECPRPSRIGARARFLSMSAGRAVERENASSRAGWVCSCRRWSIACTNAVGSRATMSLQRWRTLHFRMRMWWRNMSVRPAGRRHGQPGGNGALNHEMI